MPSTIVASGAGHIHAPAALHPYVSRRSRLPGEYAKPFPAANLQPVRQVRHELCTGALSPGDRLPSVKEVAASLAINPNTVAKAYRGPGA